MADSIPILRRNFLAKALGLSLASFWAFDKIFDVFPNANFKKSSYIHVVQIDLPEHMSLQTYENLISTWVDTNSIERFQNTSMKDGSLKDYQKKVFPRQIVYFYSFRSEQDYLRSKETYIKLINAEKRDALGIRRTILV